MQSRSQDDRLGDQVVVIAVFGEDALDCGLCWVHPGDGGVLAVNTNGGNKVHVGVCFSC